jgi:hypothetical protein
LLRLLLDIAVRGWLFVGPDFVTADFFEIFKKP